MWHPDSRNLPGFKSLRELPRRWGSPGTLHLAAAPGPGEEPALWSADNIPALRAAFIRCAPRSEDRWDHILGPDDSALAFGELFVTKTSRTLPGADGDLAKGTKISKGRFAQELADVLADPAVAFTVPTYLADAIRFIASPGSTTAVSTP